MAKVELKQPVVEEIAGKIKDAKAAVLVDYRGLTVEQDTALRRQRREAGVDYKVYKNTMVERACDECGYEDLKDALSGPNAFAFSEDATAPARVLAKFAKKHNALVLKKGIVEGKVVDEATIKELSLLPNRDGMLSMLLSCLQSPVSSFARAIQAVADAKEAGTLTVAAAKPAKEEAPAKEEVAAEAKAEAPAEEAAPVEEAAPAEKAPAKKKASTKKAEEAAVEEAAKEEADVKAAE